MNKYPRKDEE